MSSDLAILNALPPGPSGLASARPELDLASLGYEEIEYVVSGTAVSYAGELGGDGRCELACDLTADYATRMMVRRPAGESSGVAFSGTLIVEWLNVSGGMDAAPDWTFAAPEILRSSHAWAGVSAQLAGVEGGVTAVQVADVGSPGLKGSDPDRYGELHHPGDAFAYDIYSQAAEAVRDLVGASHVLAVGESQSAALLTTYVNGVQPLTGLFDGFLLHSRPAVTASLGSTGAALRMEDVLRSGPVVVRDDLSVPVLIVQAEGDLFDRIGYLPARQPDSSWLRLWEVAGAAHSERYVIGEFEEILGCAVPVNRGQQWAVVRAALRHLDAWARGGGAPPAAARLEVEGDGFVVDDVGNVRGGVRTPVVDAAVEVLSGRPWPGSSSACRLFGSTLPVESPRYPTRGDYLAAYEAATDAAIAAGFVLADDRDAVLAEARPDHP